MLEQVRTRMPVLLHGIGLSIGAADELDDAYVDQLVAWAEWLECPWVSEHLAYCTSTVGDTAVNVGLTLPVALEQATVDLVGTRVRALRERLDRPVLLENNVYYFATPGEELTEPAVLNGLVDPWGAGVLLDLHNLHVNVRNGVMGAAAYLDELDLSAVREIHIAGGMELDGFYVDAHSGFPPQEVWDLLDQVAPRCPDLGGVTFELLGSWFEEVGAGRGVRRGRPGPGQPGRSVGALGGGAVSLAAYQRAQVAMLVEPDAVRRVAGGDLTPWVDDLTPPERERLLAQAADAGLALSRKLHQGWRLTKLLTLLPITFRVGDPALLARLVDAYWRDHLPQGLYFEAEAAAFAGFVAAEVPAPSALHDAALLEGALLAVGDRNGAASPSSMDLHLTCDPRTLLGGDDEARTSADGPGYDVTVSAGPTGPSLRMVRRCDMTKEQERG